MRKFFLVASVAVLAMGMTSTASATNIGLGYLYETHPVGVFFGINDKTTIHLGFDFAKRDLTEGEDLETDIESEFGVAGTFLYDIWAGQGWGFGLSVGAAFSSFSRLGDQFDSDAVVRIPLGLMGHWDPTDWLSFWFGHGVEIVYLSPGDVTVGEETISRDSTTDFTTVGRNIADLGFTVWLP